MTAEVDPSFERLLEYVRDARAFDYTGYRRQSLMRRFEKRLQAVGSASFDEYRAYLGEHPEEFNELFNTILINVTGFFRDREAWELVGSQVIPAVLEQRSHSSPIRVWSAGCASGEEPYTIAILLAEALGEEAYRARVKIYATDVDEDALAQARDATYTLKQLEGVSDDLRERYFQSSDHVYTFRTELRRAVIFGRNDLHRDPPISRVDLLVSRNTLMYFSPDVQERILANFYFALNRGGFLVLGKAEALQSRSHLFTQYDLKRRVFVKDGSPDADFRVPRGALRIEPVATELGSVELGDTAFEHAPVAQIVVDRENRVAALNHSARAMFGLTLKDVGRPLRDLEVSYRPIDLRTIIDQVNSDRRAVSTKDVVLSSQTKADKLIDVQVGPLTGGTGELVGISVSFVDVTAQRNLQTDLETARRELESAYEELQSTVEELETTNEELQSTNEELETMNDELRDRTHDALVANTFLASVLSSIDQAVIVVDPDLAITAWSDAASELWGLRDDEVEGRHLLSLDIALPLHTLRDPVRNVLAGEAQDAVTIDGHDRRGHAVRCTISFTPLPGLGKEPAGAVLAVSAERLNAPATG